MTGVTRDSTNWSREREPIFNQFWTPRPIVEFNFWASVNAVAIVERLSKLGLSTSFGTFGGLSFYLRSPENKRGGLQFPPQGPLTSKPISFISWLMVTDEEKAHV